MPVMIEKNRDHEAQVVAVLCFFYFFNSLCSYATVDAVTVVRTVWQCRSRFPASLRCSSGQNLPREMHCWCRIALRY